MPAIKARAKAEEVRESAGHSKNQWKQFMKSTRQEAERLLRNQPNATWIDIMDKDQGQVLETVNLQLQEKDTPLITMEVLAWRMPRAMGELRKPSGTTSQVDANQGAS
ncbi:hypothetical protein BDV96DRAFT_578257 [Lophiotrema nucula]|uniref:Uncharacterized protein n=1 Tax=Lophiotrema nucula TaxID=690887 RepID=A0A6A5Z5X2_9PLEO|nr:hypothetical protein BDV96DRAFT_578257 [Lophiotrema nucula]